MGYTTDFWGSVAVEPPLNEKEIKYLTKFAETRRMEREKGPYFVGGTGDFGQGRDPDIIDSNRPPEGQPGLWCQWVPAVNETDELGDPVSANAIEWDGGEKFYYAPEWMQYIIDHFIGSDPIAKQVDPEKFSFLQGHKVNGVIDAQGEDPDDRWRLVVEDNIVSEQQPTLVWE